MPATGPELCLAVCSQGTLKSAVDQGVFRGPRSPNMVSHASEPDHVATVLCYTGTGKRGELLQPVCKRPAAAMPHSHHPLPHRTRCQMH